MHRSVTASGYFTPQRAPAARPVPRVRLRRRRDRRAAAGLPRRPVRQRLPAVRAPWRAAVGARDGRGHRPGQHCVRLDRVGARRHVQGRAQPPQEPGACREVGPGADGGGAHRNTRCSKSGGSLIDIRDAHQLTEPGWKARRQGPDPGVCCAGISCAFSRSPITRMAVAYAWGPGSDGVPITLDTAGSSGQMEWPAEPPRAAGFPAVPVDHHGNNFVDGCLPQGFAFEWERPRMRAQGASGGCRDGKPVLLPPDRDRSPP